jgi:hypothetical protein
MTIKRSWSLCYPIGMANFYFGSSPKFAFGCENGWPFELLDITTENWVRFAKNSGIQLMVDHIDIQTLDVA